MSEKDELLFDPDYAIPPGETLLETLEAIGMSQSELAERTGRPLKTINEIIKGKAEITPQTALEFQRVLGIPATFWNNLERNYREKLAELKENARLRDQVGWIENLPISKMIQLGWINKIPDKVGQLQEVLSFFGIATIEAWGAIWDEDLKASEVSFKKAIKFESNNFSISAWLRKGEIEAQSIDCVPFDKSGFSSLLLNEIRALTRVPDPKVFIPELKRLCASVGVAVVFVPELPKSAVCGATQWLSPSKALIQLSLRYKSDDHLWFTFYHEAGHILLHGKRNLFLEFKENNDKKEVEANNFAANHLIPPAQFKQILKMPVIARPQIERIAPEIGVSPGIIVGRLQHEGRIPYASVLNKLKQYYRWA